MHGSYVEYVIQLFIFVTLFMAIGILSEIRDALRDIYKAMKEV